VSIINPSTCKARYSRFPTVGVGTLLETPKYIIKGSNQPIDHSHRSSVPLSLQSTEAGARRSPPLQHTHVQYSGSNVEGVPNPAHGTKPLGSMHACARVISIQPAEACMRSTAPAGWPLGSLLSAPSRVYHGVSCPMPTRAKDPRHPGESFGCEAEVDITI
jgi:hypothetical protein